MTHLNSYVLDQTVYLDMVYFERSVGRGFTGLYLPPFCNTAEWLYKTGIL
jgi:hypothetical protein